MINIRTCRDTWHVGLEKMIILNGMIQFNKKLINLGMEKQINTIEKKYQIWAKKLWEKRLRNYKKNY